MALPAAAAVPPPSPEAARQTAGLLLSELAGRLRANQAPVPRELPRLLEDLGDEARRADAGRMPTWRLTWAIAAALSTLPPPDPDPTRRCPLPDLLRVQLDRLREATP